MLTNFKITLYWLWSYIRPVKLGTHISIDSAVDTKPIDVDDLINNHATFTTPVTKDTIRGKSESISFTEPINVSLKTNSEFELLSINMSKTNTSKNIVRIKDKKTKQVFRISMNTFRALFNLSEK